MSESFSREMRDAFPEMRDSKTCPVRWMLDRIGERWSLYVLCHLQDRPAARFAEIAEGVVAMGGPISNRMLAMTLDKLEADTLIARTEHGALITYSLTGLGVSLMVPMRSLLHWVIEHARELDAGRRKFGLPPLDLPPGVLPDERDEPVASAREP